MKSPMTLIEDHRLRELLQETAEASVESSVQPFLSDRIMRRIRLLDQPEEHFFQMLWMAFKPVVLASALLALGFISYNAILSRNYEVAPTSVEIVFGLQPMTLTSIYTSDLDEFPSMIP